MYIDACYFWDTLFIFEPFCYIKNKLAEPYVRDQNYSANGCPSLELEAIEKIMTKKYI